MRKMLFVGLAVSLLLWAGCGNVGEDPPPSPGPNYSADGTTIDSITLFVNGSFYSFDYTAQYDGLQLVEYKPQEPRDGNGNRVGGAFSSLSSSRGGGFSGSEKSIYRTEGGKALEYNHHLPNNYIETWAITVFDEPAIKLREFKNGSVSSIFTRITFWAKYEAVPEARKSSSGGIYNPTPVPSITITAITKDGVEVASGKSTFTDEDVNRADMGETPIWRQFKVTLDTSSVLLEDYLRFWKISVPQDAGRIYIDEVVLCK